MGAAVPVRDRVGKAENVLVIISGVLKNDISVTLVFERLAVIIDLNHALSSQNDRIGMRQFFVLAHLTDEFDDAVFVVEFLGALLVAAFIDEVDFNSRVQEGEFAETGEEVVEVEFDAAGENCRVREEGDFRPRFGCIIELTDHFERPCCFPPLELDQVNFTVAADFTFKPIGKRVHTFRADPVKTAGELVGALPELAAGMQSRKNQFDCGNAGLLVNVDRNSASVVFHGERAIGVQ